MRMQSSNPAFTRGGFQTGRGPAPSVDQLQRMYDAPTYQAPATARMTYDDVVARTATTIGTAILAAAVAWQFAPALGPMLLIFPLVALGLGLYISFKHVTNPVPILAYAALQGVTIGVISFYADAMVRAWTGNGVVIPAVVGTLGAAGASLAVYAFRVIRVTPKFTRFVVAAMVGYLALVVLDLVLGLFGMSFGWNGSGSMGMIASLVGVLLGCLMLMLDFDYIERGVAEGAPREDAWFAAFGLTVTLVWLYIQMLQLLTIFSQE